MARRNVQLDLRPLQALRRATLRANLSAGGGAPEYEAMYRQWRVRYLAFIQRRYDRMSRGGWPPLAESTKRRRRGDGDQAAILKDTGTLFNSLDISRADNFRRIAGGVRVGFLSGQRGAGDAPTISELGAIHHFGRGHIPQRTIIVQPDQQVIAGMMADTRRATQRIMARLGR